MRPLVGLEVWALGVDFVASGDVAPVHLASLQGVPALSVHYRAQARTVVVVIIVIVGAVVIVIIVVVTGIVVIVIIGACRDDGRRDDVVGPAAETQTRRQRWSFVVLKDPEIND